MRNADDACSPLDHLLETALHDPCALGREVFRVRQGANVMNRNHKRLFGGNGVTQCDSVNQIDPAGKPGLELGRIEKRPDQGREFLPPRQNLQPCFSLQTGKGFTFQATPSRNRSDFQ